MEKLDSYSKILLATQSINYMTHHINAVNEQIKTIDSKDEAIVKGIREREFFLRETVRQLSKIMENAGDFMNNCDIGCSLDNRITAAAFEVIHGNDNLE